RATVAAPEQQPRAGDEHNHAYGDSNVRTASPRELRATRPPRRGDARDPSGARRSERFGELSRCLIAIGRHFLERAFNHEFEIIRDGVAHDLEPRHRVERMARHDGLRRRAGERRLARERLVEYAGETVNVAAAVHLP